MATLVRPDLQDYAPASNLQFNEKIRHLIQQGRHVYHFAFGQSPFPVIETAVEGLRKHATENAYLAVAGLPELRKCIAKFHEHYDGLKNLNVDQIIVGPGSKELIYLTLRVFNGDIIVISPSWTTYKPQILLAGHTPNVFNTTIDNDWKVTPAAFEKFLQSNSFGENKLLIMNNPDNPTGTSYTGPELSALSDVFRRHGVLVLSDEIYARLHYEQGHTSIAKIYPEGTILSSGLSKWASAGGWRLGYHIYPEELAPLFKALRSAASHTYTSAPTPVQYAAVEMFSKQDLCDDYIRHTTRILHALGMHCEAQLRSAGVKVVRPRAAYYIFPDFAVIKNSLKKRGIDTCQLMCDAIFEESAVALMAGGPAFLRPVDELTTRLCFVNFDGTDALAASRKLGLDKPLPANFVQELCTPVFDGIQALKQWVLSQLEND